MKKLIKQQLLIIVILIGTITINAQKQNLWDTYFPINPNQKSWKQITTHDEMINTLNLDDVLINKLSTLELFDVYLQYPLLLDIWAFDGLQIGFDEVKNNFNALQELLKRDDLNRIAIKKYADALSKKDLYEIHFIQLLLSQKQVISMINDNEKSKLLKLTKIHVLNQINNDDSGLFEISLSTYLISHLTSIVNNPNFINKLNKSQKEDVIIFYNNCNTTTNSLINIILSQTVDLTKSSKQIEGFPTTVYTPNGSAVNAYQENSEPMSWWARYQARRYVKNNYPAATRLRDASGKYNCHSYAWYSRATSNNKWINAYNNSGCSGQNLHQYWTDGSYYQVSSPGSSLIASYGTCGSSDHSGVWVNTVKIRSKWGSLPLMEHNYNYSPYNSSNITNYKRYVVPVFSCYITGPHKATNSGTYTWYSHVSNGTAASYLWKYSYDGNNYNYTFGTTQNVTAQMPLDMDLYLKLTVTSTTGAHATDYFMTMNMSGWHKAYPNPAKNVLNIEIDKSKMPDQLKGQSIEMLLYDKMMNLKKRKISKGSFTTFDTSDLKPDVYILKIISGNEIFEEKIIISD